MAMVGSNNLEFKTGSRCSSFGLIAIVAARQRAAPGQTRHTKRPRRRRGHRRALLARSQQPAKSVVYIALGSEVPLCAAQVHELALGLELAGTRFLWALRRPHGVADADVLPPGFEERTRGRGLVVTGWAPQMSILAHGAVAAFLTHCGCSSIIEGLLFGHPLVMLPMLGDQGPNARLRASPLVGVQVPRNEDDGSFSREDVAGAVRAVLVDEETRKIFVANAKRMEEIVADSECHEKYIDDFIQKLRSYQA
ncbi:UDP-glycosyltransferase 91D2-like [Lolium perenne]|uniref:UDP-glycosyltransferase 91D2-like n=1 Tax=Lolium perenne TaxID=4522 RepID=UPI003A997DF4